MQAVCMGRHIYLASGTDSWWTLMLSSPAHPGNHNWGTSRNYEWTYHGHRDFELGAGTYYWRNSLAPIGGGYSVDSSLGKPDSAVARLSGVQFVDGSPAKDRHWGGHLQRIARRGVAHQGCRALASRAEARGAEVPVRCAHRRWESDVTCTWPRKACATCLWEQRVRRGRTSLTPSR